MGFTTDRKMVMRENITCPSCGDSGRLFVDSKTHVCDECMRTGKNPKDFPEISNADTEKKKCIQCGKEFMPEDPDQDACSVACTRAYVQQHRYDNGGGMLTSSERRRAQANKGLLDYGSALSNDDRDSMPDSGKIVDAQGRTLFVFHSHEHLARWLVQQQISGGQELAAKGLKVVENAGIESKIAQFVEDKMRGENLTRDQAVKEASEKFDIPAAEVIESILRAR